MLPSASPTAMSTFQTTYAGLQGKFAQIVGETEKALQTQSQTVRQDGGLLSLVGQLRASGTWALDTIGMTSAANQAFAIWVYQTLMPTVYDRYAITDCFTGFRNSGNTCTGVPAGPGVIGGGQNFTTIGQRLDLQAGVPCVQGSVYSECSYTTPPADLMTQIWGPVSDTCTYQPGNAGTAWTFGSCSAGVDPRSSIGANTWDFNSYSGDFDVNGGPSGSTGGRRARPATSDRARPRPDRTPRRETRVRPRERHHRLTARCSARGRVGAPEPPAL